MNEPYRYTDEHGIEHVYPSFVSRWCDAHERECSPWKPVTAAQLLERAARDETLPDGPFVAVRRAVDGETITEQGD
jgi:hypothetical protein